MRDKLLGLTVGLDMSTTIRESAPGRINGAAPVAPVAPAPRPRSRSAADLLRDTDIPSQAVAQRFRTRSRSAISPTFRLHLLDAVAMALPSLVLVALVPSLWGPVSPPVAGLLLLLATIGLPMLWVALLTVVRAYEPRFLFSGSTEVHRVFAAAAALALAVSLSGWLLLPPDRALPVLGAATAAVLLTVTGRWAARLSSQTKNRNGRVRSRVLVVGSLAEVRQVTARLRSNTYHGWKVVASCTPEIDLVGDRSHDPVRLGDCRGPDTVAEAARRIDADVVLLCPSGAADVASVTSLQRLVELEGRDVALAPPLMEAIGPRVSVESLCGLPIVRVQPPELSGPRRWAKSVTDRTVAGLALAVLSPAFLLVALLIRLDSRGSAFFRQERVGKDGEPFTMWKFRTMLADAEQVKAALEAQDEGAGPLFKLRRDPRVTRLGRLLRRSSLDELPQLINIVRGDMSLVGPRPALPAEVAEYDDVTRRRLMVRPGLTGLWQVHGRSDLSWEESKRLDVRYVENWSLGFDLSIVMRTIAVVLAGRGAY